MSDTVTNAWHDSDNFVTVPHDGPRRPYRGGMGRKPREIEPGGIYHVFSRGTNRERIFWDDADYRFFLRMLDVVVGRYALVLYAYCLMPNHFHLLLKVPHANLSAAMQYLNGGYSRRTCVRYGRQRHVFQNRFGAVHVETDAHLLDAIRYIPRNPSAAGLCSDPADWRWSSYRATAGLAFPPPFLAAREALALLSPRPTFARLAYVAFVRDTAVTVSDTVAGT